MPGPEADLDQGAENLPSGRALAVVRDIIGMVGEEIFTD